MRGFVRCGLKRPLRRLGSYCWARGIFLCRLQIHADVTGLPLVLTRCSDAPALGAVAANLPRQKRFRSIRSSGEGFSGLAVVPAAVVVHD